MPINATTASSAQASLTENANAALSTMLVVIGNVVIGVFALGLFAATVRVSKR